MELYRIAADLSAGEDGGTGDNGTMKNELMDAQKFEWNLNVCWTKVMKIELMDAQNGSAEGTICSQ